MSTDKVREEFEAWARDNAMLLFMKVATGQYSSLKTELAWQAWQASRAALCVELPFISTPEKAGPTWIAISAKENYREQCRGAIEAAGVRIKA